MVSKLKPDSARVHPKTNWTKRESVDDKGVLVLTQLDTSVGPTCEPETVIHGK